LHREITDILRSNFILDHHLKEVLQQLKAEKPHANAGNWTEKLRATMIQHRNIGYDWQFTDAQKKLLKQYYDANKLLVDCLNSDCYVSREVRQEIEDTLLLPVKQ